MNIVRLSKAFVTMSIVGAIAFSQQAISSPNEHLVSGPGPLPYGSHAESGISDPIKLDKYTFSGSLGDKVRVVISGLTNGFGPQLELLDPTGTVLFTKHCDPAPFECSTFFDQVLPATGTHTVNVSDTGLNNIGDYSLHLDRYPPTTNWVGVAYGSPVHNTLDHESDSDYFGFLGAAGTIVQVLFAGDTVGLSPHLEIWDPADTLINDTNCAPAPFTCVTSRTLTLVTSGVYRVGLSDLEFNSIGNYTLGVNCSFGNCPSTIPVPDVPEPSSYALIFTGLALVGLLAHRGRNPTPA